MNFKLKALVVAMAMTAAASAGAATTPTGSNGSSVIFSAWDDNNSYSLDLGSYLNTFIGADTVTSVSGANSTLNSTNTLAASGSVYTGAPIDILLTGFNLTSGNWNLAAGDGTLRKRLLVTETGSLTGLTNSQISTANNNIGSYIGLGAAASTSTGTLATSTDAWYANSATWGDTVGGSGITGTAAVLGGSANLYAAWQQSVTSANAGNAAGFAQLTNANGQAFQARTYLAADGYHLAVEAVTAVPEADTWLMMLAGLGLMGVIARRRAQV